MKDLDEAILWESSGEEKYKLKQSPKNPMVQILLSI